MKKYLDIAKNNKENEFFTKYEDIEKEICYYHNIGSFKNKIIYCNSDNFKHSNFVKYFKDNFSKFEIKELISSHYVENGNGVCYKFDGSNETIIPLNGNGSYDSDECLELLKLSDIIVTNPPFSLFRGFIQKIKQHNKMFLLLGNNNAVSYKDIYPDIINNKLWLGFNSGEMEFNVPDNYKERETRYRKDENGQKWRSFGNICWFTNINNQKRKRKLNLTKHYSDLHYDKYDNYDAININKVLEIPIDYNSHMGVPITFLTYDTSGYKLVAISKTLKNKLTVNGKEVFVRLIIKKKEIK